MEYNKTEALPLLSYVSHTEQVCVAAGKMVDGYF